MIVAASALDTTDVPAAVLAADGAFVRWNDAFAALTGYVYDEAAPLTWQALVLPTLDPDAEVQAREAIAAQRIFTGVVACQRAQGSPCWCEITVVPAEAGPRGDGQVLALFRDVTARRIADAVLGGFETEARFILDLVQAGIVVHAASTDIIYANSKASELLGISYDRMLGVGSADTRWTFVDARGRPLPVEGYPVVRAMTSREPVQDLVIGALRPADGQLIWGLCNAYPVLDRHGTLSAVVVSFTDITQLKRAELALSESEQRLSLVLQASTDALWDIDLTTDVTYLSPRWWDMLGYSPSDPEADIATWERHIHADDREQVFGQIDRALASDVTSLTLQFRMQHRTGRSVQVLTRAMIIRTEDGKPTRMLGTNTDVTEQRAIEARLQQSQKLEAIGQLAGGVAHDFNNLLSVITGNVELAQEDTPSDSDMWSLLADALTAARRGAVLSRRLLTFARQHPLKLDVIDVGQLVTGHSRVLRRLIHESIDVRVSVSPNLPHVEADPGLLESALLNLAINARDAMPDGGTLELTVDVVRPSVPTALTAGELQVQDYVRIAVRDTGTGMSRHTAEHAIEPFFTTKAVGQGTGLGLSMVYGFVRQSGGALNLRSAPGQGTTIALYFPAVATDVTEEAADPFALGRAREARDQVVLVAEDDPAVRRLAVRSLKALGYATLEAEQGRAALAILDAGVRVDLVLTDIVMPGGMNGRELAEAMRAHHPSIPVVFMSGYHAELLTEEIRDQGWPLLTKPFSLSELAHVLRTNLDATK